MDAPKFLRSKAITVTVGEIPSAPLLSQTKSRGALNEGRTLERPPFLSHCINALLHNLASELRTPPYIKANFCGSNSVHYKSSTKYTCANVYFHTVNTDYDSTNVSLEISTITRLQ